MRNVFAIVLLEAIIVLENEHQTCSLRSGRRTSFDGVQELFLVLTRPGSDVGKRSHTHLKDSILISIDYAVAVASDVFSSDNGGFGR